MRRPTFLGAALLLVCLTPTPAQPPPARTHAVTPDDYFTLATLFACKPSPDGKHVAYVEGRWQKSTDDNKTDLWVVEVATGKARRLTHDRGGDRSPAWSADGRLLYFLGSRKREAEKKPPYDGKPQVWRVPLSGGEPLAVTRAPGGVKDFALAPDGRSVYYVTEAEHRGEEWKALRQQFKQVQYGRGVTKVSEVWRLDVESWRAEKLIDDKRFIHEFAVAEGGRVAMITTPDGKVIRFEGGSRVDVWDPATKKVTPLPDKVFRADAASPYGWLEDLAWSQDGKALAFNVIFDAYPAEVIVARWRADGPAVFKMPRPAGVSLRGYGSPLAWRADGGLGFLGEEKARVRLLCARGVQPGALPHFETLTAGDVVVSAFGFARTGNDGAVVMGDPARLPDVYLVTDKGGSQRLTKVNPQADDWKLPRLSVVSWKGARGDPVEGVLELPPDCKEGQRLPLVVSLHGGPTTAVYYHQEFNVWEDRVFLAARGYAVLCPNYRGSTGYGDRFVTELIGHDNGVEVEDILKGVDALVERGLADPERLAVLGWSNGGYLTNCVITTTPRFKAAVSGASILDSVLEFGSNDEPAYMIVFKQGLPWTRPDRYHKSSPGYGLGKVKTPTLIHVGADDERCPPDNSRMLYRALHYYVKVPTELLVYPGEPHGLMKYADRQAKMAWDVAWLERYVLGKAK